MALQHTSQTTQPSSRPLGREYAPIPDTLVSFLTAAGLPERDALERLSESPELCKYLIDIGKQTRSFRCRYQDQEHNRKLRRLLALVLWKKRAEYGSCDGDEASNIFYDAKLRELIKFIVSSEVSGINRTCDPRSCWKCQRECHLPPVSIVFRVLEMFVSGSPGEELGRLMGCTEIPDMFFKLNDGEREWSMPWLDLIAGIEPTPAKFGRADPAPKPADSSHNPLILPSHLDQVTKDLVTMVLLGLQSHERDIAWEQLRPTIHRTVYGTQSVEEKTSDVVTYLRDAESDKLKFLCFCFLLPGASPHQAVEYAQYADNCHSPGHSFKAMSQTVFDQTEVGAKANRARGGYNIWFVAAENVKRVHGMSLLEIAEAIREADRASTPQTRKELWSRVDIGDTQRDISIGLGYKMLPILVVIALVRYVSGYRQQSLL